jgi:hypothetical protein
MHFVLYKSCCSGGSSAGLNLQQFDMAMKIPSGKMWQNNLFPWPDEKLLDGQPSIFHMGFRSQITTVLAAEDHQLDNMFPVRF